MEGEHSGGESEGRRPADEAMGIVEDLCNDALALGQVASRHGMSITALARWASRDDNADMMRAMSGLAEARAMLVATLARVKAAGALRKLVEDEEESRETRRKACVDLLKLDVRGAGRLESASSDPEAGESEIRELLARSGSAEELGGEESG